MLRVGIVSYGLDPQSPGPRLDELLGQSTEGNGMDLFHDAWDLRPLFQRGEMWRAAGGQRQPRPAVYEFETNTEAAAVEQSLASTVSVEVWERLERRPPEVLLSF